MDPTALYESFKALEDPGFWQEAYMKFYNAWFYEDRWVTYFQGLLTTVEVTVIALILGVILGVVVATIRTAHDQQRLGRRNPVLGVVNLFCKIYVTVIRGTPMMVQLMIMGFVIFKSSRNFTMVGALSLGINSGAYVAEIIRGGIMGVDSGQMEAGRSLGLSYVTTMKDIVLPQAMKSALPALINEMITLLKETSICGYIGLNELTRGGDIVRGITFEAMFPLFTVAAIYLIMVLFIQWIMGKVERRLRNSDHR